MPGNRRRTPSTLAGERSAEYVVPKEARRKGGIRLRNHSPDESQFIAGITLQTDPVMTYLFCMAAVLYRLFVEYNRKDGGRS